MPGQRAGQPGGLRVPALGERRVGGTLDLLHAQGQGVPDEQ